MPTSACDPEALLHPLRHRFHPARTRFAKCNELEQLRAFALAACRTAQPLVESQKLVRAHPAGKAEQLGEVTERPPRGPRARRLTADLRVPRARARETARDLHERRLAGAIRTEQADELPFLDLEIDAAERLDRSVALGKTANSKRGGHAPSVHSGSVPRGYEEGPVAEEAQARIDALERGESLDAQGPPEARSAVYGSTDDEPEPHFLGWADEVDADELFESGRAWGLSIRRVARPVGLHK